MPAGCIRGLLIAVSFSGYRYQQLGKIVSQGFKGRMGLLLGRKCQAQSLIALKMTA